MDRGSWHCTGDRNQDYPHGKVSFNPYPNQDALSTHQLPKMLTPVPRQMIRQRQVINDKTKPTPGKLIIWNKLYYGGNWKC